MSYTTAEDALKTYLVANWNNGNHTTPLIQRRGEHTGNPDVAHGDYIFLYDITENPTHPTINLEVLDRDARVSVDLRSRTLTSMESLFQEFRRLVMTGITSIGSGYDYMKFNGPKVNRSKAGLFWWVQDVGLYALNETFS